MSNPFAKTGPLTPWLQLGFGKYWDKTLPQLPFADPDYFFWAYAKRIFRRDPLLWEQAKEVHAKATSIRIPQRGGMREVVEYNFLAYGACVGFDLVPESRPPHRGSTTTIRDDCIDMTVPRRAKRYDKQGYRLFLQSLKHHLFGEESFQMTKKRCEAFFDNDGNFHRNGSPESTPPAE